MYQSNSPQSECLTSNFDFKMLSMDDAKKVQFNIQEDVYDTYSSEDYYRTAEEIATLSYRDTLELMQMRVELRQEQSWKVTV